MAEHDRRHVEAGEPADARPGRGVVVAEERAREDDASTPALEDVAGEQEAVAGRVEADASRGVARRVDDNEAAEDGENVAVLDRADPARRTGHGRQDPAARGAAERLPNPQLEALEVGPVHADLDVGGLQLAHTPCVVGAPVGADDAPELSERPPLPREGALDARARAGEAGVDEGQLRLEDGVRAHADEVDRVNAGRDLHRPLQPHGVCAAAPVPRMGGWSAGVPRSAIDERPPAEPARSSGPVSPILPGVGCRRG